MDQEPTDRVTDGGIDVAHKIDLSAQVQGFKTIDWMNYAAMRGFYEANIDRGDNMAYHVFGVAADAAFFYSTDPAILVDGNGGELLAMRLSCGNGCDRTQIDTFAGIEGRARAQRTTTPIESRRATVWIAKYWAQPITLLAVEARDRPGILVEVFQFQNTESAGVWLGDFDDPIILNPFDAAVFSAPAPQNPQYRQGKFSGQMGRYAVKVELTVLGTDFTDVQVREQTLAIAGVVANGGVGAPTLDPGPEARADPNPGPGEAPDMPVGPEVGGGGPAIPGPVAVLPPPRFGPVPAPEPVQLAVVQKFRTMPILSQTRAMAAIDQPLTNFQVFSSVDAEVSWTPGGGWASRQDLTESDMVSLTDTSYGGIEIMVGERIYDTLENDPQLARDIPIERSQFNMEFAAAGAETAFAAHLFVAAYEVGAHVIKGAMAGPIRYEAGWRQVSGTAPGQIRCGPGRRAVRWRPMHRIGGQRLKSQRRFQHDLGGRCGDFRVPADRPRRGAAGPDQY